MSLEESNFCTADLMSARWRELSRAQVVVSKKLASIPPQSPVSVVPSTIFSEMLSSSTVSNLLPSSDPTSAFPVMVTAPRNISTQPYDSESYGHAPIGGRQMFSPAQMVENRQIPMDAPNQRKEQLEREAHPILSNPTNYSRYTVGKTNSVEMPSFDQFHQPSSPFNPPSQFGYNMKTGERFVHQMPPSFPVGGFYPNNLSSLIFAKEYPFLARLYCEATEYPRLWEEAMLYRAYFLLDNGCPRYPFHYSSFVALATAVDSFREEEMKLQAMTRQSEPRKQPTQAPIIHTQSKGLGDKGHFRYDGGFIKQKEHYGSHQCSVKDCACQKYQPPQRRTRVMSKDYTRNQHRKGDNSSR